MWDAALPARVFDVLRGGRDNVAGDRRLAARIEAAHEGAARTVLWCDRFAAAAARCAAVHGTAGVIIGDAGFPVDGAVQPHHFSAPAWCAYADWAPEVTASRAAAVREDRGGARAAAVTARIADPPEVLAAVEAAGLPLGPVQVNLGIWPALTCVPGAEAVITRWADQLRDLPGSQLALLVPLDGYLMLPGVCSAPPRHCPADAAAWLESAGLDLILAGTDVRAWGLAPARRGITPGHSTQTRTDSGTRVVAAVGQVPR